MDVLDANGRIAALTRACWPTRFSGYRNWAALCPTWDKRTARPAPWLLRRAYRACSRAHFHEMQTTPT